jgi:hypothetical protein
MLSLVKEIMNMKKLNVALAILVTAVMAGNAQTNAVTSDIVGYQNYNVVVGLNAVGVSLINADTLKGTVSGATGSTVSITGQTNVGSLLTSGEPYYIEVYSGSSKGDRFDVDTAGTIASASGNVVLLPASANNSRSYTSTSIAAGSVVALRKHVTLEQLKNSVSSGSWFGSNTFTSADQVQILDPLTQAFTVYYLRGNGTDWRGTSTGTTIQTTTGIVTSDSAYLVSRKNADLTGYLVNPLPQN